MSLLARVFLLALLLVGTGRAEVPVPLLDRHVTDLTSTLNVQQMQSLETRLAAFKAQKGTQLAVLLVPTTQPETIEQFGLKVFNTWKLGRKGVDDGVLLLVAKDDRTLRIEVGYGLEGTLNDATAKRILAETIKPFFKNGEFYQGIEAGVASIIKVVGGEPLPLPLPKPAAAAQQSPKAASDNGTSNAAMLPLALLAVVLLGLLLNAFLSARLGKLRSAAIVGAISGLSSWFVADSWILAACIVILMFFLSLIEFSSKPNPGGAGNDGVVDNFTSSDFSSSDSHSSNDSFSGGGGESGGGGASERW